MAISPQRQKELDAMVARQKASRAAAQQQAEPKKGFLSGVAESLTKRGGEIAQTASDVWNQKINPIEGSLQFVGKGVGAVTDVLGQAGIAAVKAVTPDSVEKAVMESAPVKAGLEVAQQGMEAYESWKQKNPRVAKDLESFVNIASLFPVGGIAKAGAGALAKGTKSVVGGVVDAGTTAVKSAVGGIEKTALGSALKTGTKAVGELATEASGAIVRGTKKLAVAAEEKAAQNALPETVRALHRVGLPEETISRITTAAPETTGYLKKMATKVKERMAGQSPKARALDVPGEILTDTASKLSSSVKSVGRQLGAVKSALRGKTVDLMETQRSILQDVDALRLKIQNGKIVVPLGVPADHDVLSVLNDIYKHIGSGSDAELIDLLRTTLSKSYNKLGTPFSDNATRLMTKYKDLALKAITETDPQYGALAAQYHEQINALKEFTKLIGYKGSMEDIGSQALKAGEVTRRMLGQASARPIEVINELLAQAKKAGIDFGGNFDDLVNFADELDDIGGLTQTTGLQGAVQRAGESVVGESGGIISRVGGGLMRLGASGAEEKIGALNKFFESISNEKALTTLKRKQYPGLDSVGRKKEAAAYAKMDREYEKILDAHAKLPETRGGKLVNPDDFRPLVHDEKLFGEYKGTEAETVHEPVSELANKVKKDRISKVKKDDLVLWTAGGPGNGKGSAIEKISPTAFDNMAFGYDSVLGNPEKASADLRAVLEKGGANYIPYVWRKVEDAWNEGVIGRAKSKGRTLPLEVYLNGMESAWKSIQKLFDEFKDDPRVVFNFINNESSGLNPFLGSIEDVKKLDFTNLKEKYYDKLFSSTEELYKKGGISKEIRDGLLGRVE